MWKHTYFSCLYGVRRFWRIRSCSKLCLLLYLKFTYLLPLNMETDLKIIDISSCFIKVLMLRMHFKILILRWQKIEAGQKLISKNHWCLWDLALYCMKLENPLYLQDKKCKVFWYFLCKWWMIWWYLKILFKKVVK